MQGAQTSARSEWPQSYLTTLREPQHQTALCVKLRPCWQSQKPLKGRRIDLTESPWDSWSAQLGDRGIFAQVSCIGVSSNSAHGKLIAAATCCDLPRLETSRRQPTPNQRTRMKINMETQTGLPTECTPHVPNGNLGSKVVANSSATNSKSLLQAAISAKPRRWLPSTRESSWKGMLMINQLQRSAKVRFDSPILSL